MNKKHVQMNKQTLATDRFVQIIADLHRLIDSRRTLLRDPSNCRGHEKKAVPSGLFVRRSLLNPLHVYIIVFGRMMPHQVSHEVRRTRAFHHPSADSTLRIAVGGAFEVFPNRVLSFSEILVTFFYTNAT